MKDITLDGYITKVELNLGMGEATVRLSPSSDEVTIGSELKLKYMNVRDAPHAGQRIKISITEDK